MSDTAENVVQFEGSKGRMRALASALLERFQWAKQAGITFGGKRDLYDAFGYSRQLSIAEFAERYDRGGIAGRIIDALPYATWRGGFEVVEDHNSTKDTPFEKEWKDFAKRVRLSSRLLQGDVLSRIGTFSALFIGGEGDVSTELPRGNGTTSGIPFVRPYLGMGGPNSRHTANNGQSYTLVDAVIDSFDTDVTSPRFGEALGYRIRQPQANAIAFNTKVIHWSRVIHMAERALYDDVYGEPGLQRCWNYLDDLDKACGGGAEAFFQRVGGGRVWSIDKDFTDIEQAEKDGMQEQLEKLQHGMIRDVRMRGVTVSELSAGSISPFGDSIDTILTLIAGTTTIPKRILTGSEMGELASSQDRENWRDQVNGRRTEYAAPMILERLVNRLIDYNYLPKPAQYDVVWGSTMNLTENEKQTKATALANVNRLYGSTVFTDDEIRADCYNKDPLNPEQKKALAPLVGEPPLLKVAEDDYVLRLAEAMGRDDQKEVARLLGPGNEEDVND